MKTILLAGLISVSLLNGQNKKLLFIGIDGCRPDALTQAQTPNIDGLIKNGIYINDAGQTLSFEIFTQNYLTYMITPVQNMLKKPK